VGDGKAFVEYEPWRVVCLVGDITLLGLLKVVMNLMLESLDLVNQFDCIEMIM
jgi:hypothetical protein